MKNIFPLSILAILFALAGCKMNTHLLKCPDVASIKKHHEVRSTAHHHEHILTDDKCPEARNNFLIKNKATASITEDESPLRVKIPRLITRKLSADELQSANEVFAKYSGDKVKIEQNDKGKYFLKANSKKDFFKLAATLAAVRKSGDASTRYGGGGGGGIAVAGGILGIIAIILALGPYVSFTAFVLGILAVIFGIIGLGSSRPGWAVIAIVLGVLAVVFAGVIGIGVYVVVLHLP